MGLSRQLLVGLVLTLTACSGTTTTTQTAPAVVPQCPFGAPVHQCSSACTSPVRVQRTQYWLDYSPDQRQALWVCETISKGELEGAAKRKNSFPLDPFIARTYQTSSAAYTNSGYDRGHLAAAGNQKYSQLFQNETFYISNISPQHPKFNRGIWKVLEDWTRGVVTKHGSAFVISGPLFLGPTESVRNIVVPSHFFKILVAKKGTEYRSIAFVLENRSYDKPYQYDQLVKSVDWIEEKAGLDIMPTLTLTKAKQLESKAARYEDWK